MTGWSTFEPADVLEEFTSVEVTTLNNIKDGVEALAGIVGRVADQVRLAYRDAGRQVDSTGGTIPDGEFERAIAIARWKFLVSFPQLKSMQTEERKTAASDAEAYFKSVAMGELKANLGAQLVTAPDPARGAVRKKLDGLI